MLLGLSDRASIIEIKRAFRQLSKKHHPDVASEKNKGSASDKMQELANAYHLLLNYCSQYDIPLIPDQNTTQDAEEWWLDRFGNDPLWGKADP